jgi:hypothetical protein
VKIQLIRLEEHDDIISARDKLGWGQTSRVVLVWPEYVSLRHGKKPSDATTRHRKISPLTRRLDLVLLQRRALELGVQLAFVSRNPQVREHALSLGIPIFNTPREAQNVRWRRPRRRRFSWQKPKIEARRAAFRQQIAQSPPSHPLSAPSRLPILLRAIIFTIGMLAVIVLSAALLPGAQISLAPAVQTQTITLPVSANHKITAVNLTGEVPTYPITTIVEGQATITSTAKTLVSEDFSTGYVRLTNLTTETITVPLGTIVTAPFTDTIRFATTQEGTIPAGLGASKYITVKALSPGRQANLPVGSLRVIEGPLNFKLAATNSAPTRGGTDRSAPSPSPDDHIRLYNQLVATLRQDALTDLEAQLADGDLLLRPTLSLDTILLKTYEPENAQAAAYLRLTLRMQYHAEKISSVDLRKLGTILLDVSLPDGYTPLPETMEINILTQPQVDREQVAHLQITASRRLQAHLSKDKAVNLALGLEPQQAAQRLDDTLLLSEPPLILIDPGWWPRLPFIPLRIQVSIHEAGD